MNRLSRFSSLPIIIALTIYAYSAFSNAQTSLIQVGSKMPSLILTDQYSKAWSIPADTKLVLFSNSRDANAIAQELLSQQQEDYLKSKKTVYLSDMSKMPSFITKNFALPSLRKLPYSLGIVLNEDQTKGFPREDGALTAIFLDSGKITRIEFIKTTESLNQALEAS
jgi:hypothetical protein